MKIKQHPCRALHLQLSGSPYVGTIHIVAGRIKSFSNFSVGLEDVLHNHNKSVAKMSGGLKSRPTDHQQNGFAEQTVLLYSSFSDFLNASPTMKINLN